MHRKILTLSAAGVAGLLALSGCSASAAPAGTTEVTVWHYWDGTNADAFDAFVKEYNASHDDVKITPSNVPNADFLTKLRASATSRTLPDMAIGDLVWVPQIAQLGTLADLKGRLPADILSDINPALTAFGSIDGKQVSVPVSANNLGYMYNKTLFTEAGLDPETPPTTWEELLDQAKTITAKTGKPGYDLFTQAGDNGEGLTWNFQVNLWQAGGEFLTADNSAAAFNSPEGRKALQFWVDLIDSGTSPYAKWGEFEKGQGGSAQEGSWMVGIWAADSPFEFGAAPAPYPADGKPATNLGGEQAMVFDNSDAEAKAASDFLAWFLEPAQVTKWSEETGMLPVLNSVATGKDYLDWVDSTEPRLLPFVQQMKDAHARPNTPLYPKISMAFAQEIERALAGEASVSDALDAAEKAVNDVIEKG
ncbi:multiple sugar transport system substrate-binding protein [Microbacterium sp. W4I4]|uniref:ABC transporter substrate-binding protein n=1 Tax=Microbacterium sp. W4I4 TaxID=3042295 RepID=UPI00278A7F43|nr:ABC transporter substrate-binding protein [Microbacterium sp. W4I4]MDQ0614690.1 multiple sugar transport system substrate-binding protein [Microbacterium sp. W4I4]